MNRCKWGLFISAFLATLPIGSTWLVETPVQLHVGAQSGEERHLAMPGCGGIAAGLRGRSARAFSLIDVIVSMAVVAVLVSLMMPSLTSVRETAHRVICRSNVRQVGIGLSLYAQDSADQIPASVYVRQGAPNPVGEPAELMTLRLASGALGSGTGIGGRWDGLGLLYSGEYLAAPQIFYCPSHRGQNSFREYEGRWASSLGQIFGNYHFRGVGPNGATRLPLIELYAPGTALVADGMRTIEDFNHGVGTNVLRVDLSVDWFDDEAGRFRALLEQIGGPQNPETYREAWRRLDEVTVAGSGG